MIAQQLYIKAEIESARKEEIERAKKIIWETFDLSSDLVLDDSVTKIELANIIQDKIQEAIKKLNSNS